MVVWKLTQVALREPIKRRYSNNSGVTSHLEIFSASGVRRNKEGGMAAMLLVIANEASNFLASTQVWSGRQYDEANAISRPKGRYVASRYDFTR